jgi:hypothetical protein
VFTRVGEVGGDMFGGAEMHQPQRLVAVADLILDVQMAVFCLNTPDGIVDTYVSCNLVI